MSFDKADLKRRMDGAVDNLYKEFGGLRTGRASANLLEPVNVEAYGSKMPLNQVATVSVPESRMLSVQVWDAGLVKATEKAIRDAGLGLNLSLRAIQSVFPYPISMKSAAPSYQKLPENIQKAHAFLCAMCAVTVWMP